MLLTGQRMPIYIKQKKNNISYFDPIYQSNQDLEICGPVNVSAAKVLMASF